MIGRDAIDHVPGWDDEIDDAFRIRSPPPPMYSFDGGNLTLIDTTSSVDAVARRNMLALAIIMSVVAALLMLFTLTMFRKLKITVAVLKVGMGIVKKVKT